MNNVFECYKFNMKFVIFTKKFNAILQIVNIFKKIDFGKIKSTLNTLFLKFLLFTKRLTLF